LERNKQQKEQTKDLRKIEAKNKGSTFLPFSSLYMVFLNGRNKAAYKQSLLCSP
jgi:hypothetical protein